MKMIISLPNRRHTVLWLFLLIALPQPSCAQSPNTQVWFEYMLTYSFAKSFAFENVLGYRTLLGERLWHTVNYRPTLEYSLTKRVSIMAGGTVSFTAQTENYNTFEIRPVVGTRIHLTPDRRVLIRMLMRFEHRNFLNLDTDEWETVIRPRIRAEVLMPINKKSFFENDLWYAIADAEWLFAVDDVEERFANRLRVRGGIGHRLNYASRFEFIYMYQQSRNGILEAFSSNDHIFRIRYRHYLRTKPAKTTLP